MKDEARTPWRARIADFGKLVATRGMAPPLAAALTFLLIVGAWRLVIAWIPGWLQEGRPTRVSTDRAFTILAVNDVYRVEGLPLSEEGGLARLRTLRIQLEDRGEDVLLLLAGDFLAPSLMSRIYGGTQMVDGMNLLDGDAVRFDERMLVTFGNHEFDDDEAEDASSLQDRIRQSRFWWLGSDLEFLDSIPLPPGDVQTRGDPTAEEGGGYPHRWIPGVAAPQLVRTRLVNVGGAWVGFFSLSMREPGIAYVREDPANEGDAALRVRLMRARDLTAELRAAGAEFVVALTHLPLAHDVAIIDSLGPMGPDLVVGGHEHERQLVQRLGRYVVKADSDARTAAVIRVTLDPEEHPTVRVEHQRLGPSVEEDSSLVSLAADWKARHDRDFCAREGEAAGCLDSVLVTTRTEWDGEENRIRSGETALGDWIMDRVLERFAASHGPVDAALINSGGLRLNQDLPAGTEIQRRHLEELAGAFPNELVLLEVPGSLLTQVLARSAACRGEGPWLQMAGLSVVYDTVSGTVDSVRVGLRPLDPSQTVRVATSGYLIDAGGAQDGYTMLDSTHLWAAPGTLLLDVIADALRDAAGGEVAPAIPDPPRVRFASAPLASGRTASCN